MAAKKDKKTPATPEDADVQTPEADAPAADAPEAADAPQAKAPEAAEAPEAEAPEADAPAAEAPETAGPEADAPEAEAPAEDAPAEEAPAADESSADKEATAPAAAAVAADPDAGLSPKQRRRKERSKHDGEAGPVRSPEERHAERVLERQRKAVRRRARRLQERAKAAERRAAAPAREPLAPVHAPVEGRRRERQGIVVSDKAEKTITVRIDVARRHRRYEKIVRSSSTLHAHDENNDAHEGDVVRVIESRPLSRTKRWALVDVLERAR